MNIVPTRIQEQISQVDPTRALVYGICGAATAVLAIFKLFWLLFTAMTFSRVGFSLVSFVFPLVYCSAFARPRWVRGPRLPTALLQEALIRRCTKRAAALRPSVSVRIRTPPARRG